MDLYFCLLPDLVLWFGCDLCVFDSFRGRGTRRPPLLGRRQAPGGSMLRRATPRAQSVLLCRRVLARVREPGGWLLKVKKLKWR